VENKPSWEILRCHLLRITAPWLHFYCPGYTMVYLCF